MTVIHPGTVALKRATGFLLCLFTSYRLAKSRELRVLSRKQTLEAAGLLWWEHF